MDEDKFEHGGRGILADDNSWAALDGDGLPLQLPGQRRVPPRAPLDHRRLGPPLVDGRPQAFSVPLAPLTGGVSGRLEHAQVLIVEPGGTRVPGGYAPLLVLDHDGAPDCDGSGVNDLLEILAGTLPDANSNLIPDTCPGG